MLDFTLRDRLWNQLRAAQPQENRVFRVMELRACKAEAFAEAVQRAATAAGRR